ncbi:hypothetical protein [Nostoc sp.]
MSQAKAILEFWFGQPDELGYRIMILMPSLASRSQMNVWVSIPKNF